MYTKVDMLSPLLSTWKRSNTFKKEFLRLWPTKSVTDTDANGNPTGGHTLVLDSFTYWRSSDNNGRGHGNAIATDQAKGIYKLLNTSVKEIESKDYKGIDEVYYTVKPWDTVQSWSIAEVETAVNILGSSSQRLATFRDIDIDIYDGLDAQQSIDRLVQKLNTTNATGINYDENYKDIALALMDTDQRCYDVKLQYNGRGAHMNADGTVKYMRKYDSYYSFTIYYTKKKILSANQAMADRINRQKPLDEMVDDGNGGQTKERNVTYTHTKQLIYAYKIAANDVLDATKFVTASVTETDEGGVQYTTLVNGPVRLSYVESLPVVLSQAGKIDRKEVTFTDELSKMMGNGYTKTPVKAWKQFLNFALLVVALIATVASAGATGPLATALMATVLASTVALGALQYNEAMYGNPNAAAMYGNSVTIIGYFGAFLGIQGIFTKMEEEGAAGLVAYYAEMSTLKFTATMLNYANKVFDYAANAQIAEENHKINEMVKRNAAIEKQMADMPTPMKMEIAQWNFESYNFLEINEKMDQVPYQMTQGKIDGAMHKYF